MGDSWEKVIKKRGEGAALPGGVDALAGDAAPSQRQFTLRGMSYLEAAII